ncbi:MAG: tetratricopeptide repeat protein, partial [Nitrospinaceae bacterium]|nr:tetratricopeptide repeat protein [Nitrospinaceae bacterium]
MGYLTLAVNFHMHGFEVTGYHVVNLLIHIFSSLVLYYFVLLAFRTPRMEGSALAGRSASIAFLASLLFAVHPVQTQAVTYIVQRFASLAGLFYMLAMVGYIRARLSPTWKGRIVF